jgi:UDPglucose 6-dehydrogenase
MSFDDFDKLDGKIGKTADDKPPKEPPIGRLNPLRIGIVGHGFVGKAVDYAFTNPMVKIIKVDPNYGTTVDHLIPLNPHVVFVCAPTPMHENGVVDASIVEDAVLKLMHHTHALVVIKSTVTPDVIDRLFNTLNEYSFERLVYNPEFLQEVSSKKDFVDAKFHVMGGSEIATNELIRVYDMFSMCSSNDYYKMSAFEASFVKYGINSFLATKVTFFNQLYDLVNKYKCSYNVITRAMGADDRIGIGHTRVPGFDGKKGFGGACLPKDTSAFLKFSEAQESDFDLLREVIDINNKYRKGYDLDDREKTNNITFGDDE